MEAIVPGTRWKTLNPALPKLSIIPFFALATGGNTNIPSVRLQLYCSFHSFFFFFFVTGADTEKRSQQAVYQDAFKGSLPHWFYVLDYINNTSVPWVAQARQLSGPRLSTPSCSAAGLSAAAGGSRAAGVMTIAVCHAEWAENLGFHRLHF